MPMTESVAFWSSRRRRLSSCASLFCLFVCHSPDTAGARPADALSASSEAMGKRWSDQLRSGESYEIQRSIEGCFGSSLQRVRVTRRGSTLWLSLRGKQILLSNTQAETLRAFEDRMLQALNSNEASEADKDCGVSWRSELHLHFRWFDPKLVEDCTATWVDEFLRQIAAWFSPPSQSAP